MGAMDVGAVKAPTTSGGCDKCKTLTPQVTALRIPNPVRWIAVWRSSFWDVVIRTDIFGEVSQVDGNSEGWMGDPDRKGRTFVQ